MTPADPNDPELPISELLRHWPQTASVFMSHRMLCVGCPIAPFHTVIDAVGEYNLREEPFREELRRAVAGTANPPHR